MDQRAKPTPRLKPLPPEHSPELKDAFEQYRKTLGFIPNSVLIMQRRPKMVKGLAALLASIWDPEGAVDRGFKRLLAHVASRSAGCQYCMAHTAGGALVFGVAEEKVAAVWDYPTSPLFTPAERAALDLALAAGAVPNAASDEMFVQLKKYWTEEQIVEIVGVIAAFGFLNRWNDTMATPLEDEPIEVGEKLLAPRGWSVGKHGR
jgi:uncharacterized peroxidase-related enzyme